VIDLDWCGTGLEERAFDRKTGHEIVCVSPEYYRPVEVPYLSGDATKAKTVLGWTPKVTFCQLVKLMVSHDLRLFGVDCPFDLSCDDRT
jgi:GDPmannose 4,6-dehydratase